MSKLKNSLKICLDGITVTTLEAGTAIDSLPKSAQEWIKVNKIATVDVKTETNDEELDARGDQWDPAIHKADKSKTRAGNWKKL
jgi:hypothetical protein